MRPARRDVAIAVSAFLLVGAALVHVLAGTVFVPVWPKADERVRSVARDATVLDTTTGRQATGVTLERRRTVVARPSVVDGSSYYLVSTSTQTAAGRLVARQRWAGVQDARSGEAIPSPLNAEKTVRLDESGDAVEVNRALPGMSGQLLRLPRDTPERDVVRWDPETTTASVARFERRTTLLDRDVLVFRQVATFREGQRSTRSDTTVWVRPEVGAVVRTRTHLLTRVGSGATATVVMDATFVDDPRDVRAASGRVDDAVTDQRRLRVDGPLVALLASMLTAVVAACEERRARRSRDPVTERRRDIE